jgi:phosphoserine phosphatase
MSPNFFAEQFYEFGFDLIYSSGFTLADQGRLCADHILCPEDKPRLVEELCKTQGFAMLDSIAFGDSMSDYPLFRALSHTVAVNSDDELSRLARMTYHGLDLYDALLLVCGHIQSPQQLEIRTQPEHE